MADYNLSVDLSVSKESLSKVDQEVQKSLSLIGSEAEKIFNTKYTVKLDTTAATAKIRALRKEMQLLNSTNRLNLLNDQLSGKSQGKPNLAPIKPQIVPLSIDKNALSQINNDVKSSLNNIGLDKPRKINLDTVEATKLLDSLKQRLASLSATSIVPRLSDNINRNNLLPRQTIINNVAPQSNFAQSVGQSILPAAILNQALNRIGQGKISSSSMDNVKGFLGDGPDKFMVRRIDSGGNVKIIDEVIKGLDVEVKGATKLIRGFSKSIPFMSEGLRIKAAHLPFANLKIGETDSRVFSSLLLKESRGSRWFPHTESGFPSGFSNKNPFSILSEKAIGTSGYLTGKYSGTGMDANLIKSIGRIGSMFGIPGASKLAQMSRLSGLGAVGLGVLGVPAAAYGGMRMAPKAVEIFLKVKDISWKNIKDHFKGIGESVGDVIDKHYWSKTAELVESTGSRLRKVRHELEGIEKIRLDNFIKSMEISAVKFSKFIEIGNEMRESLANVRQAESRYNLAGVDTSSFTGKIREIEERAGVERVSTGENIVAAQDRNVRRGLEITAHQKVITQFESEQKAGRKISEDEIKAIELRKETIADHERAIQKEQENIQAMNLIMGSIPKEMSLAIGGLQKEKLDKIASIKSGFISDRESAWKNLASAPRVVTGSPESLVSDSMQTAFEGQKFLEESNTKLAEAMKQVADVTKESANVQLMSAEKFQSAVDSLIAGFTSGDINSLNPSPF